MIVIQYHLFRYWAALLIGLFPISYASVSQQPPIADSPTQNLQPHGRHIFLHPSSLLTIPESSAVKQTTKNILKKLKATPSYQSVKRHFLKSTVFQRHARKKSHLQDLQNNRSHIFLQVSRFLTVPTVSALEQTAKDISKKLKDAPQYHSIMRGFQEYENPEADSGMHVHLSTKEKFLEKYHNNPEFRVYLADLKLKYLPAYKTDEEGLHYYLDQSWTPSEKEKIKQVFKDYLLSFEDEKLYEFCKVPFAIAKRDAKEKTQEVTRYEAAILSILGLDELPDRCHSDIALKAFESAIASPEIPLEGTHYTHFTKNAIYIRQGRNSIAPLINSSHIDFYSKVKAKFMDLPLPMHFSNPNNASKEAIQAYLALAEDKKTDPETGVSAIMRATEIAAFAKMDTKPLINQLIACPAANNSQKKKMLRNLSNYMQEESYKTGDQQEYYRSLAKQYNEQSRLFI